MSREAVKYKITLEREDGGRLNEKYSGKICTSFHADNYLSREYIMNCKKALFSMMDTEITKHTNHIIYEEVDTHVKQIREKNSERL